MVLAAFAIDEGVVAKIALAEGWASAGHLMFERTDVSGCSASIRVEPPYPESSERGERVTLSGRAAWLVALEGTGRSPCELLPDGSRRWALTTWVSHTYSFSAGPGRVQEIRITATSKAADPSACLRLVQNAVISVTWFDGGSRTR